jgi:quinol monooxygenase YgiN
VPRQVAAVRIRSGWIAPGRRDEYLKPLQAHAKRCVANEPGTLQFEIAEIRGESSFA